MASSYISLISSLHSFDALASSSYVHKIQWPSRRSVPQLDLALACGCTLVASHVQLVRSHMDVCITLNLGRRLMLSLNYPHELGSTRSVSYWHQGVMYAWLVRAVGDSP
ncbi:hypothetical protein A0H81_02301 [Grifola frondosa]|uniref:Uncharacterized protein n=1 Tax=Grifola frondosa TaxID=5627 RepID=A0A1C7MMD5_GRIFR|nr:hypothetical protein A0H81_02301 [Grifola frondosa]